MNPTCYIFRGPCGAGKTTLRESMSLPFPLLDMTDVDKQATPTQRAHVIDKFLSANHSRDVVIEGIFAPGAPTTRALFGCLRAHKFRWQSITLNADLMTLLDRLTEHPSRAHLARVYQPKFS